MGSYSPINPNSIVDSRYTKYPITSTDILEVDVWYAFNRKLLLDGLGGDFNVTGAGKVYSYTPFSSTTGTVEGTIFAGDVRRDASDNVIADTKGGFVIKSSADCTFKSGQHIILKPGFIVEYGASFNAKIVSTPHGFSSISGGRVASNLPIAENDQIEAGLQISVYPNPFMDEIIIKIQTDEETQVGYSVINALGQVVESFYDPTSRPAGEYNEIIDSRNFNKGIYFVQVRANNATRIVRLIK